MKEPIVSPANPRVKSIVRLRRRRERDATGRFLIEGHRELARARVAGVEVETLYVGEAFLDEARRRFVAAWDSEVVALGEAAFRRAAGRQHPDGLLGVAGQFGTGLETLATGAAPFVLVVESVEKPGNLGAMLRTADAAGVDGVIVADPVTDVFNPNVVRASQGALFARPVAVAPLDAVRAWLAARGIVALAADPAAPIGLWDVPVPPAVACVVGAEHRGLSPGWGDGARLVRIPMAGASDSLNAAMAAGLLMYEVVRRRSGATSPG